MSLQLAAGQCTTWPRFLSSHGTRAGRLFLKSWIHHYELYLADVAGLHTSFCSSSMVGEGEGGVDFLAGRGSQKRE